MAAADDGSDVRLDAILGQKEASQHQLHSPKEKKFPLMQ
jgi:hypothetical protein